MKQAYKPFYRHSLMPKKFWEKYRFHVKALLFIFISIGGLYFEAIDGENNSNIEIPELTNYSKCVIEINEYIRERASNSKLTGTVLLDKCLEYNINPSFALAQGYIESGLGTMGASKVTNNIWSVGHYDRMSTKNAPHYKDANSSIEPYMELLNKHYLNKRDIDGLLKNFVNSTGHRYASNTNYEKSLRDEYKYINKKYPMITQLFNSLLNDTIIDKQTFELFIKD